MHKNAKELHKSLARQMATCREGNEAFNFNLITEIKKSTVLRVGGWGIHEIGGCSY